MWKHSVFPKTQPLQLINLVLEELQNAQNCYLDILSLPKEQFHRSTVSTVINGASTLSLHLELKHITLVQMEQY